MKLYFYKPDSTSLTIDVMAAKDVQEAFEAGRYVYQCGEVKDRAGNKYDVVLVPRGKRVEQGRLF